MLNHDNKKIELFVPGRLCLFGEHTDWAGRFRDINADIPVGRAIVTGIDLGLYAKAEKADDFTLITLDEGNNEVSFTCAMDKAVLEEEASKATYFCYACGVAAYLMENYRIGGIRIHIYKSTLPVKKGLSSSASICVLVARAFNELYRLNISTNGEMQVAFRGERLTSSRCGRLDQACAYGVRPVCMDFDGERISVEKLNVGRDLYWVFADLKAGKDTKKILSDLNRCYPFPQDDKQKSVTEALGKDNHAVIAEVRSALENGDAESIGRLMTYAQKLFDEKVAPMCTDELESPVLHKVLSDGRIRELTYGGKGVGSQGDGTIQFIARDKESQARLVDYMNSELKMQAYPFTIKTHSRVRKAVIPLAGFATRMYPASLFTRKAFFPVVDENNVAKPLIMYLLEELDKENMEEIILVIGEGEQEEYESLFSRKLPEEVTGKLPKPLKGYEGFLERIQGKIRYAVQEEKLGFGHAVYQAYPYLEDNEPVLMLLGDFIYRSSISTSCMRQTINAYEKTGGKAVVSIMDIPLNEVIHYGCLTGEFDNEREYLMHVTQMKEKPTVEYAKDYLGVTKNNKTSYYATFGQYILTPEVFRYLKEDIEKHEKGELSGEVDLTVALQNTCENGNLAAVLVDGKSYDAGIPDAYVRTVSRFGE